MNNLRIISLSLLLLIGVLAKGQTPVSISVTDTDDGGEVAREGRIFTYTYGNWGNNCYAWGFDKTNTNLACINGNDQPTWNCADWFTSSSSISGNIAYLNTTTTVRYMTTGGSYTNGTLSARLKFTATTTGGTPINFGENGNIIFVPVTENFRIEVEIELRGPGGAIWGTPANPNNYAFSWSSALNVFDALHTDPSYQIYTSYNNTFTGFYTIPSSSSTPVITSPTCGSSTTSSGVTFWWTDPCTIHPESHYEWSMNGGAWTDNFTSNSEWEALNLGENTFQVRYYDGCNEQSYTSSICYIYRIDPDYCGDVNHGGNDWTISSNTTVAGRHYNVGTFTVNSGVTATVDASCHYFMVEAEDINVQGTINANGAGENGGSGGVGGSMAMGDNGSGALWWATSGDCNGGFPGEKGHAGSGPGGGNAGNNGGLGNCTPLECGGIACIGNEDGYNGGGGGAGAGSGGSYGGTGGYGAYGGAGAGFTSASGGSYGSGGASSNTYGTISGDDITWGSGGGGAGGGGGAFGNGTHGGNGGSGGGMISLKATHNCNVSGTLTANGGNGGDGGDGSQESFESGYDCSVSGYNGCSLCPQEVHDAAGGAGGGGAGGSGGGIKIESTCGQLSITGNLSVTGGNGGTDGIPDPNYGSCFDFAKGGAGGGGGRIKIFSNDCLSHTISASYNISGGTGGNGYSNGNSGNNGTYYNGTSSSFNALNEGNVGNNQSLCYNDPASNLISIADASGGSCATTLYQWMQCTSGCGSPPTNYSAISSANSSTYNPGNLTQTTWFVRRVTTDNCTEYTTPVEIEMYNDAVAEGTWVGNTNTDWFECTNWGNGRVPISTMNVTIPSGCTYYPNVNSTGAVCNRLTVQNGGSLTVSTGNLTIYENFYKQNGGSATFSGGICNVRNNYYNYGTSGETRVNGGTLNIGTASTDREFINYDGQLYVTSGDMDCGRYLYNYNGYTNNYVNISGGTVFADRIPNYEGDIYHSGGTLTSNGYYRELDAAGGNYYGSNTAVLNLNGSTYIRLMSAGTHFAHLNINGNYYITTDSNHDIDINGNITIAAGQTLTMNNFDMNIAGNFTNNGNFVPGNGWITFDGSSPQNITTNGDSFYDVSFNNTGGSTSDLVLLDDFNITHSASFTDGIVNAGSYSVIFADGATANSGTASSFVNGEIIRTGSNAFTYPTGDVPNISGSPRPVWAPVKTDACATSTITAQYHYENPPYDWWFHNNNMDLTIDHVTDREYWDLTTDNATPAVTLFWTDNTNDIHSFGTTTHTQMTSAYVSQNLTIAHYNTAQNKWNDQGASLPTTIYFDDGQLQTTVPFPNYSPVTFASKRSDFNLPVELISFSTECRPDGQGVNLSWTTASETNNNYFTIMRSMDGESFDEINRIIGNGTSNEVNEYLYNDENTPSGKLYYKLMQTDFDGTTEQIGIQACSCKSDKTGPNIELYPVVTSANVHLAFNFWPEGNVWIKITDMSGRTIQKIQFNLHTDNVHKSIDVSGLAPGMYLLSARSKDIQIIKKFQKH